MEKFEKKSRGRREEIENATLTDRDLNFYEGCLEIPITKEFLGERVLDLGSGRIEKFAQEAAKRNVEVYSLNPALTLEKHRERLEKVPESIRKRSVAGFAQELPFKSDVFDSVLSMWAIPYYLKYDEEEYENTFKEIIRVLKPGRRAFLIPVLDNQRRLTYNALKKIRNEGLADTDMVETTDGRRKVILTKPEEKKNKSNKPRTR